MPDDMELSAILSLVSAIQDFFRLPRQALSMDENDVLVELDNILQRGRRQTSLPFPLETIELANLHENACNPVLRASARAILET